MEQPLSVSDLALGSGGCLMFTLSPLLEEQLSPRHSGVSERINNTNAFDKEKNSSGGVGSGSGSINSSNVDILQFMQRAGRGSG